MASAFQAPPVVVAVCVDCGEPVDTTKVFSFWQHVDGWERKREQGGTNHVAQRTVHDQFLHVGCMTLRQAGINPNQGSFDV